MHGFSVRTERHASEHSYYRGTASLIGVIMRLGRAEHGEEANNVRCGTNLISMLLESHVCDEQFRKSHTTISTAVQGDCDHDGADQS